MYAKLSSYSGYLLGGRVDCVRVVLGRGDGGPGAASTRLVAATTRRLVVRVNL
jgi:hypothetical protein